MTSLKAVWGNYPSDPVDFKRGMPWYLVTSIDISPDGKKAISGHVTPGEGHLESGVMKLWNVDIGKEIYTFHGHSRAVNSVALSPCSSKAVSASTDGTIRLWDVLKAGKFDC
ncbi:MAG: hypothetical protein SVY10_21515 [Thermodesulfobacteriota bacterium]|nr:hypothetical protein [Thermodesulfobacteriota bacterium]